MMPWQWPTFWPFYSEPVVEFYDNGVLQWRTYVVYPYLHSALDDQI